MDATGQSERVSGSHTHGHIAGAMDYLTMFEIWVFSLLKHKCSQNLQNALTLQGLSQSAVHGSGRSDHT